MMSSRLIVKGLPTNVTEGKLRALFGERGGSVTDCQLKYTKEGVFRRFAFVGFQSAEQAADARLYFDKTFINTSRIIVQDCEPFGSGNKPRAWSKYASDSTAYARLHPEDVAPVEATPTKKPRKTRDKPADDKFTEFLEAQGKAHLIQDDEAAAAEDDEPTLEQLLRTYSGEELKVSVLVSGLPAKVKRKSVKEFVAPVRPKRIGVCRGADSATAVVTLNRMPDARRILQRSGEFLGGFQLTMQKARDVLVHTGGEAPKGAPDEAEEAATSTPAEDEQSTVAAIMDTGRLFVRNLSYLCTEQSVRQLFETFGQLTDVTLPVAKGTQKPKGFAVVTFVFPEHAAEAFSKLDGTVFQGRMLHILAGKEKPGAEKEVAPSSFKGTREAEQKATAGAQKHAWNALFLGANAVADAVAAELAVDKGSLLDAETSASLGVRLALGETRLVSETRQFLTAHGVALDSFGRADGRRSERVLLVKNLPAATDADELRRLFARYGDVGRLLLPPNGGITALVEFVGAAEAKAAFKALAYARFKRVPLFLEWAPGDVFFDKPDANNNANEKQTVKTEQPVDDSSVKSETSVNELASSSAKEADATIFVKNLSFETVDEALAKRFEQVGPLVYATVSKKPDPKRSGQLLSMGFGFVQFQRRDDAQRALKDLQGTLLNGHCLELKVSHRQSTDVDGAKRRKGAATAQGDSSKLLVRNLPFEATDAEVRQLFDAFGQVRSLRLPKKLAADDGAAARHRGFAFVDFVSAADAKRAFDALCHSTHLYGRRLVLEWAREDESLDDIRKRTADHFETGAAVRKRGKEKRQLMQTIDKALD